MCLFDSIALGAMLAAASTIIAQEEAAPAGDSQAVRSPDEGGPPIPEGLPAALREELAMLEARLRVRETRIRESERFLELERLILEENKRQGILGGVSPRQVELIEVRVAEAEAQLEARRAERDQAARMVEELRRRIASPSPELDVEQRRAILQADVLDTMTRLQAQEARLRAAELQVESEMASQENFVRAIRDGLASPMALQQAMYRIVDSRIWRDLMDAERDAARIALERARRRLDDFDRGDRDEDDLRGSRLNDLEARVKRLENEVQVLRDEVYFFEEARRRSQYGRHDRFGRTGPEEP